VHPIDEKIEEKPISAKKPPSNLRSLINKVKTSELEDNCDLISQSLPSNHIASNGNSILTYTNTQSSGGELSRKQQIESPEIRNDVCGIPVSLEKGNSV
jgi:hypothetical protein